MKLIYADLKKIEKFSINNQEEYKMGTSTLILAENSPVWPLAAGADVKIYGTTGTDKITIPLGTTVTFDSSFNKGGDTIYIQGDTSDFTVQHASGTVTLTHKDGSVIIIPAGVANSLVFGDGDVSLKIDAGKVMFGDQAVTTTAAAVTATLGTTTSDSQFGGGVTPEPGDYTITCDASVAESGTLTVTVTADAAVTADTELSFSIAGLANGPSGDAAEAIDFASATSGKVTIPKDGTTVTFQIKFNAADGAEFDEDFKITLKDAANSVVATKTVTILDSSSEDTQAPVATAATVEYAENATDSTVLATVAATDNIKVTNFEIVSGNDSKFFEIDATGKITLTAAGVASVANDYEATPNSTTLGVVAVDAAGNKSVAVDILLKETDVDDVAPTVKSATIAGTNATLTFSEPLSSSTPKPTDFAVTVSGGSSSIAINSVSVSGQTIILALAQAPAAGQTYEVAYTPGTSPIQDASPAHNPAEAFSGIKAVLDTTAPVITPSQVFTYQEMKNTSVNDIVATVLTDDPSVASFKIESGNANNYYAIDNKGNITLTAAGLASGAASNDFETTPNSFTLGISATDGAGNKSATTTVTINVTNNTSDDLEAPIIANLTTGADPQTGVVLGSNNDDTISGMVSGNAGETTLSAIDFINAGANGVNGDTLNIQLNGASYAGGATIQNIENLKLTATNAQSFNANGITSLVKVINNASANTLTVNDLASSVLAVNVNTIANGVNAGIYNWAALTGAEKLTVTLDGVGVTGTNSAITFSSDTNGGATSFGEIDLVGNGTASFVTLNTTGVGAQTTIKTIKASGAADLTVALAADGIATTATTIDASASTGKFILSGLGAATHTVTGGSGDDSFNFGANLDVTDVISGGSAGMDTLGATGAQLAAMTSTAKATVSGIDELFMTDDVAAVGTTVTASLFGGSVTNIRIADQSNAGVAAVTFNAIAPAASGSANTFRFDGDFGATGGAYTFSINNATDAGTSNSVVLDMRGVASTATSAFTMNGVENLTINTVRATGTQTFNITDAALQNVTILGGQSVDIDGVALGAGVAKVDASGLTGTAALSLLLTAAGATTGCAVTTAGGADTIVGSSLNDTINTGAGADTITGGLGADKINGGIGNDTFNLTVVGQTGVATFGTTSTSTSTLDIYTVNSGDLISLAGLSNTYAALGTLQSAGNLSSTLSAATAVSRVIGVYDSVANTFTVGATGANSVLISYDNTAAAATADESILLVGVTDVASIAAGVITV